MKLLRGADHRRMPWKNGGGETLEIAVSPAGAGIDAFDWRVSMAVVAADGSFSAFTGIDRTIVLLDGAGMTLVVAGHPQVTLTPASEPFGFSAEAATMATLTDGAITDLNVMTARGRYAHAVERFTGWRDLRADGGATRLLIGDGSTVGTGGRPLTLGPRDVVLLEAGETACAGPAGLLVTISPIA